MLSEETDATLAKDADLDGDGYVNFREQCMHPLLANYWSSMTRTSPKRTPFDTFEIPRTSLRGIGVRYPKRPSNRGDGLYMPNYLNKANFDGAKAVTSFNLGDPCPPPAGVVWGSPMGTDAGESAKQNFVSVLTDGTVVWSTLAAAERWTKPDKTDSDTDGMPDGWEGEHGLNPLLNDNVSGVLGDPDVWLPRDVALVAGARAVGILDDDVSVAAAHRALVERSEPWAPWRSYAVVHLWRAATQHAATTSSATRKDQ